MEQSTNKEIEQILKMNQQILNMNNAILERILNPIYEAKQMDDYSNLCVKD